MFFFGKVVEYTKTRLENWLKHKNSLEKVAEVEKTRLEKWRGGVIEGTAYGKPKTFPII